jgi:uncharacterized membrane protein
MRHRTAWSRWGADLRVAPARMAARHQARRGIQRADARSTSVLRRMRTNHAKAGGPSALLTVLLVSAAVLVVSLNVLVGGYVEHWAWTGYRDSDDKLRPLWDWLVVSVLPLTVALTPLWLRTRGRRRRAWRVAAVLIASVLAVCALGGYLWKWTWTGFTGNTLYDWLALFLVPCVLPVTFMLLDSKQPQASVDQHESSTHHASSRARLARGGAAAWAIGAAVLLVVGTVAVLLEVGFSRTGTSRTIESHRPGQAPVRTPSSLATPAPQQGHRWLIVESQDPWWTDTGIHVTVGENVSISAVGRVRASPRHGYSWASPSGLPLGSAPRGYSSIDKKIEHAALVATVGHPGQVGRLDHGSSSPIIDVGKNKLVPITRNGELFLGLNDQKTDDNRGWFGATITLPHDR